MRSTVGLLLFAFAGCAASPSASIGPAGGSLVVDNGQLRLDVPAGALTNVVTISARRVPAGAPMQVAYELLPEGLTFATPARITLDGAGATPLDAEHVAIAKRHDDGTFEIDGASTISGHTVSTTLAGFSTHGLIMCNSGCPSPPSSLTAMAEPNGHVQLAWQPSSGVAPQQYVIERAEGPGGTPSGSLTSFSLLTYVTGDKLGYDDATPCANRSYRYRVRALSGTILSDAAGAPTALVLSSSQVACQPGTGGTGGMGGMGGTGSGGSVGSPGTGGGTGLCKQVQVTTIAGSGTLGFVNGAPKTAQFAGPTGIVRAPSGVLYVADEGNAAIRAVQPSGMVSTFALLPGLQAGNLGPAGVALDDKGLVYSTIIDKCLVDTVNGQFAFLAGGAMCAFQDGAASMAEFNMPYGIVHASSGTIYVADSGNYRVRAITSGQVSTLAGNSKSAVVDGTGTAAGFVAPLGLALDEATGTLWVADSAQTTGQIRRVDVSTGAVKTLMTNGDALTFIDAIAFDGTYLYVGGGTSSTVGQIYRVNPSTGLSETLAGSSTAQPLSDSDGCSSGVGAVGGIVVDGKTLYFTDAGYRLVRSLTLP